MSIVYIINASDQIHKYAVVKHEILLPFYLMYVLQCKKEKKRIVKLKYFFLTYFRVIADLDTPSSSLSCIEMTCKRHCNSSSLLVIF